MRILWKILTFLAVLLTVLAVPVSLFCLEWLGWYVAIWFYNLTAYNLGLPIVPKPEWAAVLMFLALFTLRRISRALRAVKVVAKSDQEKTISEKVVDLFKTFNREPQ